MGFAVSVLTTQLCWGSTKATTEHMKTNECGKVYLWTLAVELCKTPHVVTYSSFEFLKTF